MDESVDNEWRNGPAKYWYDLMSVEDDCHRYDYGFKLKPQTNNSADNGVVNGMVNGMVNGVVNGMVNGVANGMVNGVVNGVANSDHKMNGDSDEAFNLVSQLQWERDVIWDADMSRKTVMKQMSKMALKAGWLPVDDRRYAPNFIIKKHIKRLCEANNNNNNNEDNSKATDNSANKVYGLANTPNRFTKNGFKSKLKDSHPIVKTDTHYEWCTSLDIENHDLVNNRWEEEVIWDPEAMDCIPAPKVIPLDPNYPEYVCPDVGEDSRESQLMEETLRIHNFNNFYNISNDEYYDSVTKADIVSISFIIMHSIPALELNSLYFPRCVYDFENFFKPKLKKYRRGALASAKPQAVLFCYKRIKLKERCLLDLQSLNDTLLMKTIDDLTACDGTIVLMEYSEQYPPLLMRNGMGSKIINYFKKNTSGSQRTKLNYFYGENKQIFAKSPFLGELSPGESLQAIENNLFRAPIFHETTPDTDFLIIRTNNCYSIREINANFLVGQQLPLMEVPAPRSNRANDLLNNFIKAAIYRMFKHRRVIPKLKDELKKEFEHLKLSDCRIRKCLNACTLNQENGWILKNSYTEDQIRALITPEECCAYYSMIIADSRLRAAGFGDRLYFDNNDYNDQINDINNAPWNTTRAYISASKGNQLLNVNASAINKDCSLMYSTISNREFKVDMPFKKKCEPILDRYLKRKSIKFLHEWLINYGLSPPKVKAVKNRFEAMGMVSDLSKVMMKNKDKGVETTERLNKSETFAQQYKTACQTIFDRQLKLFTDEELFSDSDDEDEDEDTDEHDSEIENMGRDLEEILLNNKTLSQINREREEKERKELINILNSNSNANIERKSLSDKYNSNSFKGKILKITRTYVKQDGVTYNRSEIVRNPNVIAHYVRLRETKDSEYIRNLSSRKDHAENESRILNSNSKAKLKNSAIKAKLAKSNGIVSAKKQIHNRSLSSDNFENNDSQQGFDEIDFDDSNCVQSEELVRIDETKVIFSKKVVEDALEISRKEQVRTRQEVDSDEGINWNIDYTLKRTVNRVRYDPHVKLVDYLDKTILLARKLPQINDISVFLKPVDKREVPDYYDIITSPVDLRTIRAKVQNKQYISSKQFLSDMELLYLNSEEYNGRGDEITCDALELFKFCKEMFDKDEVFLSQLDKEVHQSIYLQTISI